MFGSGQIVLLVFAALALAALLVLAVRTRALNELQFFYRLFLAHRHANRFYAECPWVTKNIAFHSDMTPRLDVYRPEAGTGHPVVIYVYGGSWRSGNKELYAPAAQRLLPSGFVLVIPDYTLFPKAGYPRQTEEIAAAIAWTLDHIADFGGDPRRVVLIAQSAGAQIAGLALLEPRWLAAHHHSASDLRGFVGISGVYDFGAVLAYHGASTRTRAMLAEILGGADNAGRASPMSYVTSQAPPALLIHGDADTTVPISVGLDFHHRLQAAGVPSEFITFPGAGHADILFRALTEQPPRLFDSLVSFVRRCTSFPSDVVVSVDVAGTPAR
jgi:acetyl esterase/lipase